MDLISTEAPSLKSMVEYLHSIDLKESSSHEIGVKMYSNSEDKSLSSIISSALIDTSIPSIIRR